MLATAFAPFDGGPIAIVGLVPLLWAWRGAGIRQAALLGFVAGLVFFGVVVHWAALFGVVAYLPFVGILALYWAGAGAMVGLLGSRGVGGPLTTAAAWVLFEVLRSRWPLGGFSWGEVGYAFHDIPWLRSLASYGGVALVSLVAVLAAGLLISAVTRAREGGFRTALPVLAGLGALLLTVGIAHALRFQPTDEGALRVAVVQANDQNRELTAQEIQERFLPRRHFALAERLEGDLDLVVFPESSLDTDPRTDPFLENNLQEVARRHDTAVLANAPVLVQDGTRVHNTNFFYDRTGNFEGTYVKQHLVPFGEYVPLRSVLGFVDALDAVPVDHAPGDRRQTFEAAGTRFANLICFESAFTEIARGYVEDGAGVLVVSTNNRSFERSANADQHVAIGQMRAAETGRPVVYAAISGVSAFIDHDGDLEATTELFEPTILSRTVIPTSGRTPYVILGDWVALLAGALLAGAGLVAIRRHRDEFAALGNAP